MIPFTRKNVRALFLTLLMGQLALSSPSALAAYTWPQRLWDAACVGWVYRYSKDIPPLVEEHDIYGVMARMRDGWRSWDTMRGYWEQIGVPAAHVRYASQFPPFLRLSVFRRSLAKRLANVLKNALDRNWITPGPQGFRRTAAGKLALLLQMSTYEDLGMLLNETPPAAKWEKGELPSLSHDEAHLLMEVVHLEREARGPVTFEAIAFACLEREVRGPVPFEATAFACNEFGPAPIDPAPLLMALSSLRSKQMIHRGDDGLFTYTASGTQQLRVLHRFYTSVWLDEQP